MRKDQRLDSNPGLEGLEKTGQAISTGKDHKMFLFAIVVIDMRYEFEYYIHMHLYPRISG